METERETRRGVMQMSRSTEVSVELTVEVNAKAVGADD